MTKSTELNACFEMNPWTRIADRNATTRQMTGRRMVVWCDDAVMKLILAVARGYGLARIIALMCVLTAVGFLRTPDSKKGPPGPFSVVVQLATGQGQQ